MTIAEYAFWLLVFVLIIAGIGLVGALLDEVQIFFIKRRHNRGRN